MSSLAQRSRGLCCFPGRTVSRPPSYSQIVPVWMINDVANVPKHTRVCVCHTILTGHSQSFYSAFFFFNGHKLLNSSSDLSSGL